MESERNDRGHGLSVILNYGPLGLVRGVTRDIRGDGLWVDTGRITLTRNAPVEVTFSVRRDNKTQVHRFNATVAGTDTRGTSLSFQQCPSEVLRVLHEISAAPLH